MEEKSLEAFEYETLKYDMNAQFNKVCAFLANNTKQADEMYALMGILIDKIQYANPGYAPQCKEARTFLQKLKDGLFNTNTLLFGYRAIQGIATGASGASIIVPLLIVAVNMINNFQRK